MTKKQTPLSGKAKPQGAEEQGYQHIDCTTNAPRRQALKITDYIPVGRDNPTTATALADALGFEDTRAITRMIERERLNGAPICAACTGDHLGYYLAASPEELADYLHSFRRRSRNVQRTEAALNATYHRMTGQQHMNFEQR